MKITKIKLNFIFGFMNLIFNSRLFFGSQAKSLNLNNKYYTDSCIFNKRDRLFHFFYVSYNENGHLWEFHVHPSHNFLCPSIFVLQGQNIYWSTRNPNKIYIEGNRERWRLYTLSYRLSLREKWPYLDEICESRKGQWKDHKCLLIYSYFLTSPVLYVYCITIGQGRATE